jgi:gliding motility-associated-like protein
MNPGLTTSIYSTVFGSNSNTINISPTAFLVDTCERVYVGGWGGTTNGIGNTNNMTTTSTAHQETTDGSDFYFIVLEEDAVGVEYATYFGGDGIAEHVDGGTSRFDKNGVIYEAVCAGCNSSDDFPTQSGVWSEVNGSANCNLGVIKLNMDVSGIDVEITSGVNQNGCAPFTVQFDSDTMNTINFMWDFGDGNTSTEADPSYTYENSGVYQVVLTGENFSLCGTESFVDTAYATITVNESLVIANAGPDTVSCGGASVVLGDPAVSGVTYSWIPADGLNLTNVAQPQSSPIDSTTYILNTIDLNGCTDSDTVFVNLFGIIAGPDTTLCFGDSVQVFVSGGDTFSWSPPDEVSDPNSPSPFVYAGGTTELTVNVSSDVGCEDNATVTLLTISNPEPNFEILAEPSCDDVEITFTNLSQNSNSYLWSFGDGSVDSTVNAIHSYPTGPGPIVYLVAYTDNEICNDTMYLDLSGEQFGLDTLSIRFGNVITPNSDGLNDCFKPHFSGVYSDCYELVVYNRWGNLQFESIAGQENCWDGRNKAGIRVSKGTYYYIVRISDFEKAGWVEVVDN